VTTHSGPQLELLRPPQHAATLSMPLPNTRLHIGPIFLYPKLLPSTVGGVTGKVTKHRAQILTFVRQKCFIIDHHTRISGGSSGFYWKSRSGLGDADLSTSWGRWAAETKLLFDIAGSLVQLIETHLPDHASIPSKEKASNCSIFGDDR